MRLTVAVATSGRREILSAVLGSMADQTRKPDLLAVCPARKEDLDGAVLTELPFAVQVVSVSQPGLAGQRNAIMRAIPSTDILLFFDDDFLPAPGYLAECEAAFEQDQGLAMLTGTVIADGAQNAGIDFETARSLLAADRAPAKSSLTPVYNCYGCNMALRAGLATSNALQFDENLPLYGWLEDVDFSRKMARFGAILQASNCRGVHMAAKNGRSPGRRLGYSQIANPVYLWRKGTLSASRAVVQMARNVLANIAKTLRPEPWVDRRGRLSGNLAAMWDVAAGKVDPRKITHL